MPAAKASTISSRLAGGADGADGGVATGVGVPTPPGGPPKPPGAVPKGLMAPDDEPPPNGFVGVVDPPNGLVLPPAGPAKGFTTGTLEAEEVDGAEDAAAGVAEE